MLLVRTFILVSKPLTLLFLWCSFPFPMTVLWLHDFPCPFMPFMTHIMPYHDPHDYSGSYPSRARSLFISYLLTHGICHSRSHSFTSVQFWVISLPHTPLLHHLCICVCLCYALFVSKIRDHMLAATHVFKGPATLWRNPNFDIQIISSTCLDPRILTAKLKENLLALSNRLTLSSQPDQPPLLR